jgi:two-component system, NarL family, nitrate/nitrite response regulator NarL
MLINPARVVIAGDQALIRTALARLIESEVEATVVAECELDPRALAAATTGRADVVLLDLDLDARSAGALERLALLLRATGGIPTLVLTAGQDGSAVRFALRNGAAGLVCKDRPAAVLARAVQAAAQGETWLEHSTMAALFRTPPASEEVQSDGVERLTAREQDVVRLAAEGLQNKAIAEHLFISQTTVRHHLTSIFAKLGVSNRLELMRLLLAGRTLDGDPAHLCPLPMAASAHEMTRKTVNSSDAAPAPDAYRSHFHRPSGRPADLAIEAYGYGADRN